MMLETKAPSVEPAWACVAGSEVWAGRGVARFAKGSQALLSAGRTLSLLSGALETGLDWLDSPRQKEGDFLEFSRASRRLGCRG